MTLTTAGPTSGGQVTAAKGIGPGTSLSDKVQAATSDLSKGETSGACTTLGDFISQVSAQGGKKISPAQANQLIADAKRVQAVIGC